MPFVNYFLFMKMFYFSFGWYNPLYTGELFHCYILDESFCYLMGVGSILSLLFYF